jgi:hypothetical protein
MEEELEKTILYVTSANSYSSNNNCTFVYDMIEPLKDIVYIKIMKTEILANHNLFMDGEPVFIKLNDYKRISTVINGNATKFFETVSINKSDKSTVALSNDIIPFKKDSTTSFHKCDPNLYQFKPIESNIKSFTFELYDQNNEIFDKSRIAGFNMTICVYHRYRKISQF